MMLSLTSARLRLRPLAGRSPSLEKISELEEIPLRIAETIVSLGMEEIEVPKLILKNKFVS